jgi:flagella basal body P-ring formation protein FlgA
MQALRTNWNSKSLRLISASLLLSGCVAVFGTSAQAAEITATEIKQAVTAHVQEKLGTLIAKDDQQNVTVNIIQIPTGPFHFPDAKTIKDVSITASSSLGDTYSERAVIRLHMESPGGISRDIGIPVKISIKKPVWVVKNIINANEPLSISNFTLQVRDVSHGYSYLVGQERNLSNYVARVGLRPGEILDARKIVIPPDVTYNDEVRILISNSNGMTISVPGIALSNGRIGEIIRVRQSVFQRKSYSAKVIDKNQVLVEM